MTLSAEENPSLARQWLRAAQYHLTRPVVLALAAVLLVAGVALNWSWLVAAGFASIIVAVLPCAIMCALGLCMMKRNSG
jgi:hypothetical protein